MRKLICILCLITVQIQAATVTHKVSTASTANAGSYVSGAFVPASGDLLIAFVTASATSSPGTMTDSQGLGFTRVTSTAFGSGLNSVYCFVSDALATASSMTVTFDCTGDNATGAVIQVASISGMSLTGLAAIVQSSGQSNQSSSTPAPVFAASVTTTNPTLGVVGGSLNPPNITEPGGWAELDDTGYNIPSMGAEYVARNSGFTGTTVTWGSSFGANYADIIVELDATAAPTPANTGAFLQLFQ
jgi:hypothetical protein